MSKYSDPETRTVLVSTADGCQVRFEVQLDPTTEIKPTKRARTKFTSQQVDKLNEYFEVKKYPTRLERYHISLHLGLGEKQVKIWFQNRRMKEKLDAAKPKTLEFPIASQCEQELPYAQYHRPWVSEQSVERSDLPYAFLRDSHIPQQSFYPHTVAGHFDGSSFDMFSFPDQEYFYLFDN